MLISLTDDYEFGMFAIASAEPRPAMVVVMDKLAKILQARPEPLVVRGHTDRRPYRTGTYDNWRLSAARAHMAYVMLARSGVDEKRFERIEGHADRSLRVADDPEAAQNRRIEILLRKQSHEAPLLLAVACSGRSLYRGGDAHCQEEPQEPFELARSLRSLQDRIARGDTAAFLSYRTELSQLAERARPSRTRRGRMPRNVRAAVAIVLSGGDPQYCRGS